MAPQKLPASTNFQVSYEDSILNADIRAQAVAAVCEHEFTVLTGWFGITGAFGTSDRINVLLDIGLPPKAAASNGGYQSGGQTKIIINPQSAFIAASAVEIVKMMFVNELVEVFMSYNNQKGANRNSWKADNSDGEALSLLCGIERFRTGHYLYYSSLDSLKALDPKRPIREEADIAEYGRHVRVVPNPDLRTGHHRSPGRRLPSTAHRQPA